MAWHRGVAALTLGVVLGGMPLRAQESRVEGDSTRTVVALGEGSTAGAATQAALRAAVEQAVGVFVTSQMRIENDRLIRDRVLSTSTGFVRRYEVVDSRRDSAGVTVRIAAVVALTPLREALAASGVRVPVSAQRFFRTMDEEDARRRREIEMLAALFWEDVDQPSPWDFKVAVGTPSRSGGDFDVPVTVEGRLNANYASLLRVMRSTLSAVAGPANRIGRGAPLARLDRPLPFFARSHTEVAGRSSLWVWLASPCERAPQGEPFECLWSSVSEESARFLASEAEFPDAPYRGGYVFVIGDSVFLLRSLASAMIIANYANQALVTPSYAVEIERASGPTIRFSRDLTLDLCRLAYLDHRSDLPVVDRGAHVSLGWRDYADRQPNSGVVFRPLDLPTRDTAGVWHEAYYGAGLVAAPGSAYVPLSRLTLRLPEDVMRDVASVRIVPTGTRLVNGIRAYDVAGGRTVPLTEDSPQCEGAHDGRFAPPGVASDATGSEASARTAVAPPGSVRRFPAASGVAPGRAGPAGSGAAPVAPGSLAAVYARGLAALRDSDWAMAGALLDSARADDVYRRRASLYSGIALLNLAPAADWQVRWQRDCASARRAAALWLGARDRIRAGADAIPAERNGAMRHFVEQASRAHPFRDGEQALDLAGLLCR